MRFELLKGCDYGVSKWPGGTVRQLVINPREALYAGRGFLWRLSSALVELPESSFTPLPDYDRLILVLEGTLKLSHDEGDVIDLAPFEAHAFDGAASTHAWGRCVDFNLMTRKGRCAGALSALHPREPFSLLKPEGETFAFYCVRGQANVWAGGERFPLCRDETLLISNGAGDLNLTGEPGAILIHARIFHV